MDYCHYCEKAIKDKRNANEINHDEMNRQIRELAGKISGKRVMKFRYVGHDFCVCPSCLENINKEVNPKAYGTKADTIVIDETAFENNELMEVVEEKTAPKSKKSGAKSNDQKA